MVRSLSHASQPLPARGRVHRLRGPHSPVRRRKASNRIECHLPKTDFGTVALCPLVQVGMMRMFGTNAAHAKTDLAVRGTVANQRSQCCAGIPAVPVADV